ncbi:hypothetical protein CORC01_00742 [Colletotrichum orchidophilum]|uniref:Clr5 domain-containing protein n=1 Tax=Colletotrichum orchidophilum TaxID=1209926 RepID=A0A1G4BR25_9PEZI|nr:uncharacterized protein CORC01_00742 [Colletotrichum orchidophilum]OHF03880.1 hypothetical protein CORC01_00742 [Colletotrichum orchidophilum]
MSSRQRQAVISDAEWERVRPAIRQLYLREDMTLGFVLAALKTVHSFHASKAQLEWKLKQWHMIKNMTVQQWRYADVRIRERQSRGKKSSLYLSGIPLRPAAVEKARNRHCYVSVVEQFNPGLARSATSYALSFSSPNSIARMMQHGYRFNFNCYRVAENRYALDILPLLQKHGALLDRVLLTTAILQKVPTIVDWYIASGVGINTVHWHDGDRYYGTPLRAAAMRLPPSSTFGNGS